MPAGERDPQVRTLRERALRAAPLGIAAGIASYVLSYASMLGLLAAEGESMLQEAAWIGTGFILYNAHHVGIAIRGGSRSSTVNHLGMAGSLFFAPAVVYYLVPISFLLVAGYLVARRRGVDADLLAGAVVGATVTVGYLAMVVVGTFLFTTAGSGGASASPDPLMSIVLAGFVYPVVFGGAGGAIAAATVR